MIQKYTLQFITPCFCRGADGKTIELRGNSIKGALRFWFRAIGCFNELEDTRDMKEKEAEIFGGTIGEAHRPSPIKLKIEHENNKEFKLCFIERKEKDSEYFKIYFNLLELVSILGGIGSSTRKGYGCFNILNQANNINEDEKEGKEIDKYVEEKLNLLNMNMKNKSNDKNKKFYCIVKKENLENKFNRYWEIKRLEDYKNIKYPFIKKIYIKEINNQNITNMIKKQKTIKDVVQNKDLQCIKENWLIKALGGDINERFASPIYVSQCEYKNKTYLIITELYNTFKDVKKIDIDNIDKEKINSIIKKQKSEKAVLKDMLEYKKLDIKTKKTLELFKLDKIGTSEDIKEIISSEKTEIIIEQCKKEIINKLLANIK